MKNRPEKTATKKEKKCKRRTIYSIRLKVLTCSGGVGGGMYKCIIYKYINV